MKRLLLVTVLSALWMHPLYAQTQVPTVTLQSLRDQKRVLLVFDNGNNQLAEQQLTVAANHVDGFKERDLLLVGISGSNPAVPTALLSGADDAAARKQFHVAAEQFTVLLIGKDGGEKLRSHQPITWSKLKSAIDAMPMRQQEAGGSGK